MIQLYYNKYSSLGTSVQFSSVQLLTHVPLVVTPWTAAHQASLSITNSRSLLKTHVHQVGDAIQPSHPLLSPSPPLSIFPNIRVFSNEAALHIRWPKYWSFRFSISPSHRAQSCFPVSTHINAYMSRSCKTWKILKIQKQISFILKNIKRH